MIPLKDAPEPDEPQSCVQHSPPKTTTCLHQGLDCSTPSPIISRNQRFAFRRVDSDFYIWPSSSIMRCAHISFERSPQVFSNDADPIAAAHGRPVQYSRNHAYRQGTDPPPPIPSSPRGRGLVEPYRPLGPLPPRAVRAVARPGPHPVADGRLVDVAALAAPPCGLAAYGLHAGGLHRSSTTFSLGSKS